MGSRGKEGEGSGRLSLQHGPAVEDGRRARRGACVGASRHAFFPTFSTVSEIEETGIQY